MKFSQLPVSIITAITLFSTPIEATPLKLKTSQSISSLPNMIRENEGRQVDEKIAKIFPLEQTVNLEFSGSQVIARFIPKNIQNQKIGLSELASILGYHHFNWVSYVAKDPYGIADKSGKLLSTPYNDPPQGGYYYEAADKLPFYWDVDQCDRCLPKHHYQNPKITNEFELVFEDVPSDYRLKPGESIEFITHLVGVESLDMETSKAKWHVLYTFKWKLTNSLVGQGSVSLIEANINPLSLPPSLQQQMKIDGAIFHPFNSQFEQTKKDNLSYF
jgi:hypothetical protein